MLLLQPLASPTFIHSHYHRLNAVFFRHLAFNVSRLNLRVAVSASSDQSPSFNGEKRRKVVEHICLLKAKQNLSEEDENDMLDYLYTSQYQMRGIVAISLGRISNDTVDNYTHAVFMRFQRKEDVLKFYENPFYLRVLKEHVMPYCHGLINADYESEVEDDILHIFRKGEEFNYGVEFVHLMSFDESAFGASVEDALASVEKLTKEFPSLIVQSTQGSNFNLSSKEYTHGVVTRFRSLEAFEMFMASQEYKDVRNTLKLMDAAFTFVPLNISLNLFAFSTVEQVWRAKFELIIKKTLPIYFLVDPVGKEIM